jgi:hypothetical protein
MPDDLRPQDDVFAERIARVLRKPERFGDEFERDLVEAIKHDGPVAFRSATRQTAASWWRTPITVRVSPIAALALAASVAGIAIVGGLAARPRAADSRVVAAQRVPDTVHVVRFVFVGDARSVALVGDFNAWQTGATPLVPAGSRSWSVSLTLPRGRYEYAFIVDGKRWEADPFAPASADEFDTRSSIVTVGS